jgi:20S proteasome subunit alpha 2
MIATNGVVLATEKKASTPLNDPKSTMKIERITPDIGATYAGMGPDFRKLITNAQKASHKDYKLIYNEYPPVEICVEMAAQEMQKATQQGGTRPYGVSLLIAGWDETGGKRGKKGPSLYQVDPSGTYFGWKATAIGKNATSAKTFLEKRYSPDLELEDAIHIALLTLKETIEGEMNGDTIELGTLLTL